MTRSSPKKCRSKHLTAAGKIRRRVNPILVLRRRHVKELEPSPASDVEPSSKDYDTCYNTEAGKDSESDTNDNTTSSVVTSGSSSQGDSDTEPMRESWGKLAAIR